MAKARTLERRRRSVRNVRKITRTMELISRARFKRAMDRAVAAGAYARRLDALVARLARRGAPLDHPLLASRGDPRSAVLLVLTANRGLCGGYNSGVLRLALARLAELKGALPEARVEVSGKRGIAAFRYRRIQPDEQFTHFEDKPRFAEVELLAERYLEAFVHGGLDRLEVAYTRFESPSRQQAVVETLLPLGELTSPKSEAGGDATVEYDFLPSAAEVIAELLPASFKNRLYKCFLDAAVSEQIARMVAMKAATENAEAMINTLSLAYNRARQGQITSEILEVVGGAEALNG